MDWLPQTYLVDEIFDLFQSIKTARFSKFVLFNAHKIKIKSMWVVLKFTSQGWLTGQFSIFLYIWKLWKCYSMKYFFFYVWRHQPVLCHND